MCTYTVHVINIEHYSVQGYTVIGVNIHAVNIEYHTATLLYVHIYTHNQQSEH